MLILSRKPGQSILIGGIIEITVAEVRGDQVRLGITAPRSIPVFRTEVITKINSHTNGHTEPDDLMDLLSCATDEVVTSLLSPKSESPPLAPSGGIE